MRSAAIRVPSGETLHDQDERACSAIDRDYTEIEITAMWRPALGVERARAMRELGVHRLVARMIPDPRHDLLEQIARVGDEVIAGL